MCVLMYIHVCKHVEGRSKTIGQKMTSFDKIKVKKKNKKKRWLL